MAGGHYGNFIGQKFMGGKTLPIGKGQQDFFNRAFAYAEQNGVTARSIMDEAPVGQSHSPLSKFGGALGMTMTVPEVFSRSMAFMTFAQQLKDSGKFKTDHEIFQLAEEYTNKAMVDYRAHERPMFFSRAGIAGNALNTLQTFPWNFYNQWAYFTKEAARGNPLPFVTAFAVQYLVAGAMGVPGVQDAYKLYDWIKNNMLPTSTWIKAQQSDFWSDPKRWALKHSESSVYGLLSTTTDLGMTNRVAAPGMGDMVQAPGGPILDVAKQAGNWASLAADPTNATKQAQAIHGSMLTDRGQCMVEIS